MTADPGAIAPDHWAGSSPRWGAGTWMSPSVALLRRRVGQSTPKARGEKRTGQAGAGACWGAFFNSLLESRGSQMSRRRAFRFFVITSVLAAAGLVHSQTIWSLSTKNDSLTDAVVTTATLRAGDKALTVRCNGTRLEFYVDFGRYLSSELVSVRYRIDKAALHEELWNPSATGTAIFARDDASITRDLIGGETFIIEAQDYRGQPHRASFDLGNAQDVLPGVLEKCGLGVVSLDEVVDGLRKEIALALERWGPKMTDVYMRALTDLGFYNGPIVEKVNPEFALAVQVAYDDYIERCRTRRIKGINCDAYRLLWDSGKSSMMPAVSAVLYEIAPKKMKAEAGKLRIGD